MDISLKDAWKAVTSQVEMTGKWKKILEDLIEDLLGAREDLAGVFESAEEEASRMIANLGAKIEEVQLQNRATIGGLGGVTILTYSAIYWDTSTNIRCFGSVYHSGKRRHLVTFERG